MRSPLGEKPTVALVERAVPSRELRGPKRCAQSFRASPARARAVGPSMGSGEGREVEVDPGDTYPVRLASGREDEALVAASVAGAT